MNDHDYTFKICVLGDSGTGKSSLVHRLCDNIYNSLYSSTIGVDFKIYNLYLEDYDKNFKLQIWDTAGQEKFISIVRSYFRKMAGCIIVYDVTNIKSLKNIKKWIDELLNVCIVEPSIVIAGNKYDLKNNIEVFDNDINDLMSSLPIKLSHKFISVKENYNIDNIFYNMCKDIYEKIIYDNIDLDDFDIKSNIKTFKIIEKKEVKKKCC